MKMRKQSPKNITQRMERIGTFCTRQLRQKIILKSRFLSEATFIYATLNIYNTTG
jgi:hypothetical protein